MKRKTVCFVLCLIFINQTFSIAQDKQKLTPQDNSPGEIMSYIERAVAMVQEKGETAYKVLTDPDGPWVGGNYYIYVNNFDGFIVAHLNKKLVGRNMYGVRDVKGNPFFAQLQAIARSEKGYGWAEFWWPKPNSTVPAQKLGFVMRVPGKKVWVGTGIYDMKQEDIDIVLNRHVNE